MRATHHRLPSKSIVSVVIVVCLLSIWACSTPIPTATPWNWQLSKNIPEPSIPSNNSMTAEKVLLGRYLFYDKRLSADQKISCASCHFQKHAFADGKKTPKGANDTPIPRNSMGLANVAYYVTYTWGNPVLQHLEQQILVPLFVDFPPELHIADKVPEVLARLAKLPLYQKLFREAFPNVQVETSVSIDNIVKALACFMRSMVSTSSPYDHYLQGKQDALSSSAKRGMKLFFSKELPCKGCHSGIWFSKAMRGKGEPLPEDFFANNGLYNLGKEGLYPFPNTGLHEFTQKAQDMGKFRIPSLRNIGVTAPYMHDGSISTLRGVIEHYAKGGRTIETGKWKGDGSQNPHKSQKVQPFTLNKQQIDDLIAFLHSLTDPAFLKDKRFADPFANAK